MILEHAAYFLNDDYQILNEAVADKSIPNAVRWVINWLDKIGLGKDPNHEGVLRTNFNNAEYYRRTIADPDVTGMTPAEANAARAEVNNRRRNAPNTHFETEAEAIVERIVEEFSHPIDYNRNGKHKMFIQAFTRIALTECNFLTEHPNVARIEMLKKCYLTATMMWKRDSSMFGNDCNMQNITYGQLVTVCKPHFEEMHELWQAEKSAYEEQRNRRIAIERIKERRRANGEDPDAEITDEMIAAEIAALNGESAEDETPVEPEVDPETIPHIPPTTDPDNPNNPYNGMENPYMEGSFRLGRYNITRIDNYEQSHTWRPFTNTTDGVTNPNADHGGGISWCITYGEGHWNYYGCGSRRTVYYAWTDDFRSILKQNYPEGYGNNATPYTDWGRSLMCIMIDQDSDNNWHFAQCTSRYNHGKGEGNSCSNPGFGDTFYHNDDHDAWAKKVAEIIGVDFEAFKEKLPYKKPNRDNNYTPVVHDANAVTAFINEFKFYKDASFHAIAKSYTINEYDIKIMEEDNEYAIVLNGNRITNDWFSVIPSPICYNNKMYFVVKTLHGKFNILDDNGNYLLKNDVIKIISSDGNKKYFIIILENNDHNEFKYNILDLSTKKLKLKQPRVTRYINVDDDFMRILINSKSFDYTWNEHGSGIGQLINPKGNIIIDINNYIEHGTPRIQVPYCSNVPNSNKDFLYIYHSSNSRFHGNTSGYVCYKMKENIDINVDEPLYYCADRYSYYTMSNTSNAHFITAKLYDSEHDRFEPEPYFCFVTKNAIKKLQPIGDTYHNNNKSKEHPSVGFIKNTDLAYYVHKNYNDSLSVVILKYNDNEITEYNRYNLPNINYIANITPADEYRKNFIDDNFFSGKYLMCGENDGSASFKLIDTVTGHIIPGNENIKFSRTSIEAVKNTGLFTAHKNHHACACKIDFKNNKLITLELPAAYRNYIYSNDSDSKCLNSHFDYLKFCHSDNNNNFIFGLFYDGKLIAMLPKGYNLNALSNYLVIACKIKDVPSEQRTYIILNEHGKRIFDGIIKTIISVPGNNNEIGSFKDNNDVLYYFNNYGDVSRNLENVEESTAKHISKEKLFLEKVAYYC